MSNKQEATFHDGRVVTEEWSDGCPACRKTGPKHWSTCSMVAWQDPKPETIPVPPKYEDERQPRMVVTEDSAYGVKEAWQPTARPGEDAKDLPLNEWVGQALGAASSCWANLPKAGVFDSTRCVAINDALMARLERAFEETINRTRRTAQEEAGPLLGLATTRSLLEELQVRFQVTTPHPDSEQAMEFMLQELPEDVLTYRTVDDHV